MSNTERHNGWTNYATWRVNLEFFDGVDVYEFRDQYAGMTTREIANSLQAQVLEVIEEVLPDKDNRGRLTPDGMVRGWATAFVDDVNWFEIAESLADEAGIETK
jgi:hypothetical protein